MHRINISTNVRSFVRTQLAWWNGIAIALMNKHRVSWNLLQTPHCHVASVHGRMKEYLRMFVFVKPYHGCYHGNYSSRWISFHLVPKWDVHFLSLKSFFIDKRICDCITWYKCAAAFPSFSSYTSLCQTFQICTQWAQTIDIFSWYKFWNTCVCVVNIQTLNIWTVAI